MLHPSMLIRPDDVIRSGIIQPFSVRSMDPVQYARAEIDPFISAIRPTGANLAPNSGGIQIVGGMGGGLGIVRASNMPLWGGLGQTSASSLFTDGRVIGALAGAAAVGALAGFFLGRKRRRR